jgi:hypothetical protein
MRPCPFGAGTAHSGLTHFLFPMSLHGCLGVGSCLITKTPSASCPILPPIVSCVLPFPIDSSHAWPVSRHEFSPLGSGYTRRWQGAAAKHTMGQSHQLSSNTHQPPFIHPISALGMDSPRWPTTGSPTMRPHGGGRDNRGGTCCGDIQVSHRIGDDAPGSELLWEKALCMAELKALAAECVKEICPRGNNNKSYYYQ